MNATMVSPASLGRPWWRRPLALTASALLVACEGLVGIHDSRDVPEGVATLPDDSAAMSAGGGVGATDRGGPIPSGAPSGPSGSASEQSTPLGLAPKSGATEPGGAPPDVNGEPGAEAASETTPDAGAPAATEPGEPDEAPDPPGNTPPPMGELVCPPEPVSPARTGTAFLFTSGPNDGNADGRGICGFRNALLPRAPRFYGAVESALMEGAAALCGACMRVALGSDSVDVTVVDVIEPNPLAHGQTLSIDADAKRVLSSSGDNLDVSFSFVPCATGDTVRLQFAAAGDPSVLVLGHRNSLESVRLTAGGRSVELERRSYNYWEPPDGFSLNGSRVTLTLTDVTGSELVIGDLAVVTELLETGKQFPLPECTVVAP